MVQLYKIVLISYASIVLPFAEGQNATLQPYKYNSKELDMTNNLYDYGARHYDAALCRWNMQDRYAEKYYACSPYSYCMANPIGNIDVNGDSVLYNTNGEFIDSPGGFNGNIYIKNDDNYTLLKDASLSAKAYSNIYSNVLQTKGYDMSKVSNRAISIHTANGDYNEPSKNCRFLITRFVKDMRSNFKISVNQEAEDASLLYTVENIQNSIGDHEYKAHGILKYGDSTGDHYRAYMYQMNQASWHGTTQEYKRYVFEGLKYYLGEASENIYRMNSGFLKRKEKEIWGK